jgi:hypothetical protein
MKASTAIPLVSFAVAALVVIAATGELAAQGTKDLDGRNSSRPVGAGEKIPPHQQPRASDAPTTANKTIEQMSAEDKALDQKLRGICRGC